MWEHQGHHLGECRREGTVLRNDLLPAVQRSVREWRNGTSFGLSDLEALLTVAHEAKEWIAAHAMKR